MWTYRTQQFDGGYKIALDRDGAAVAYSDVLTLWQTDATFRSYFIQLLQEPPYSAYRWETPSLTSANVDRPFEFVILNSPGLAASPDPEPFAEHFAKHPKADVVQFANLGRNAILIVPCPKMASDVYGHLAAFVRGAPDEQVHALWATVGEAMSQRVGKKPVWLSTAGAGVSWLHVRLDDSPKYYGYRPYRL